MTAPDVKVMARMTATRLTIPDFFMVSPPWGRVGSSVPRVAPDRKGTPWPCFPRLREPPSEPEAPMNRRVAGLIGLFLGIGFSGCAPTHHAPPVMVPPQIDLKSRETIGIIQFA